MGDIESVFGQRLDRIATLVRDSGFRACFLSSVELTRFASTASFKHGVFISEILESVFVQIGPLFAQYRIPPQERTDIVDGIGKSLSLLASSYNEGDKVQSYGILEDLRFKATQFQITCISTMEPSSDGRSD